MRAAKKVQLVRDDPLHGDLLPRVVWSLGNYRTAKKLVAAGGFSGYLRRLFFIDRDQSTGSQHRLRQIDPGCSPR